SITIPAMRPVFDWNIGARSLPLGKRTLIMGVVNVTPDSFSDGGKYLQHDAAVAHGLQLLGDGADIIDVGGVSTRPGVLVERSGGSGEGAGRTGKESVSEQEELDRVLPVISTLKQKQPQAVVSVDTYRANVAQAAVKAGAEIVNDVSGFRWDPEMKKN